jgi:catechol 2,3-dioxygenase-like lactoylglutathione lyase family enzyme
MTVRDADAAARFLIDPLGARPLREEARPQARMVAVEVAGAAIELVEPAGPGAAADALVRQGEGLSATIFGVRRLAAAHDWFTARGVVPVCGGNPRTLAIPPAANLGLRFEFREG